MHYLHGFCSNDYTAKRWCAAFIVGKKGVASGQGVTGH
jgi:hypothetical protein